MVSEKGGEPAIGDKIKAKRSFENEQEELEDAKYAILIMQRQSRYGKAQTMLMVTPRQIIVSELALPLRPACHGVDGKKAPRFTWVSDFHRTV